MPRCPICGEDFPEEVLENGICQSCQASILLNDEIPPDADDFTEC